MPTRNVYIDASDDVSKTAQRVFKTLSIQEWEERDSDNYPDGFYFKGTSGDIVIKISSAGNDAFTEYPFSVSLTIPSESAFQIDELLNAMVVELLQAGFPVARQVSYKEGLFERELFGLGPSSTLIRRRDTRFIPED